MSLLKKDFFNLSNASEDALETRLEQDHSFSREEINKVSQRSERLFAEEITKEITEEFRVLAKYSKVNIWPSELVSHRKFIGPAIIQIKKILFRLIGVLLKDTLASQEVFNRSVVKQLAKLK